MDVCALWGSPAHVRPRSRRSPRPGARRMRYARSRGSNHKSRMTSECVRLRCFCRIEYADGHGVNTPFSLGGAAESFNPQLNP
eukprot:5222694-Prymnesium_polylepis.1